jgi:galactose mutarotase-like enzyme
MSSRFQLKNDELTAVLTTQGAELVSLTDAEGIEYIWGADERYWKRHTPILFPIVGKIVEGKYSFKGKEYLLPAHGFARDMVFEVENETKESITFVLTSSLNTKAMYPFDFCLKVIYTLEGKRLHITYEVVNVDSDTLYFKIGAHPGIRCPLFEGETIEDYYLEFEKQEDITELLVTPDVYLSNETRQFARKEINLTKDLFKDGPLVFSQYKSASMSLKSLKNHKKLTVEFENFPFLGIWSTTDEAPFICIEPWYGHADFVDDSKEITEKKDILGLKPTEVFKCTHSISIG